MFITKNISQIFSKININLLQNTSIHTSVVCNGKWNKHNRGPTKWLAYNKVIYPPQTEDEERRPAFICHMKTNIKYSPEKMWYIAAFIRGMSVDEAIRQLAFVYKKGSAFITQTLLEAQDLAVKKHNVEFRSNLWIAESNVGKGKVYKGVRRHARMRVGHVEYKHCHYFVRLEEGPPPEHYLQPDATPAEQLNNWLDQMRKRKIYNSL